MRSHCGTGRLGRLPNGPRAPRAVRSRPAPECALAETWTHLRTIYTGNSPATTFGVFGRFGAPKRRARALRAEAIASNGALGRPEPLGISEPRPMRERTPTLTPSQTSGRLPHGRSRNCRFAPRTIEPNMCRAGLKFLLLALPAGLTAAASWVAPIAPRHPEVPAGVAPNPVDRFINDYLRRHNLPVGQPVIADAAFARRVYFDLWGWPPNPGQLQRFVQ